MVRKLVKIVLLVLNTLVTENEIIPDNSLVMGSPGRIVLVRSQMKKQNQLLKTLFIIKKIGRNIIKLFFKELTKHSLLFSKSNLALRCPLAAK